MTQDIDERDFAALDARVSEGIVPPSAPMPVVVSTNTTATQAVSHKARVTRMRDRNLGTIGVGVNLDSPSTDFANIARSFGLYGEGPIHDPDEIHAALERGLKVVKEEGRTALIDTLTQPR